ncbi:hypothetical protein BDR26DRAFT_936224 [Obelidium mucronatum]|nr:hypothetical protein BDR26DRAFT_936224 [Obelidium mucronatum]
MRRSFGSVPGSSGARADSESPFFAAAAPVFDALGLPAPNALTQSGLTLAALGAAAALVRGVGAAVARLLARRLVVKVEVDGRDEAHAWLLAWLAQQRFVRASTRFCVQVAPSTGRSSSTAAPADLEHQHLPATDSCGSRARAQSHRALPLQWPADAKATERIVVSTLGSLWNNNSSSSSRKLSLAPPSSTTSPAPIRPSTARHALELLIEESRRKYAERDLQRTVIYSADQYGNWRRTRSRPIRPLSTIVLDGSTKSVVLEDAKEFLLNEKWYADRGIPFRRGYMFFGFPGTGKTSFVTALAGELKLNIYVISLANKGLTDETLTELMVDTPPRCILLLEDIDAAFVSRTMTNTGTSGDNTIVTNVTFSGLLNAIDGVAAQEGRILIMTTNHIEKLDAALIRPGRVDVKVLFDKATRSQVHDLFIQFFKQPPVPATSEAVDGQQQEQVQQPQQELDPETLAQLALEFSKRFPERGISMAAVQGHLMRFKQSPREAERQRVMFDAKRDFLFVKDVPDAELMVEAAIAGDYPFSRCTKLEYIESGTVHVFKEDMYKNKKQHTDGLDWSPSRSCGPFLLSRQVRHIGLSFRTLRGSLPPPEESALFQTKRCRPNTIFVPNGLAKRTVKVVGSNGLSYRVVSYFTPRHVEQFYNLPATPLTQKYRNSIISATTK